MAFYFETVREGPPPHSKLLNEDEDVEDNDATFSVSFAAASALSDIRRF